MTFWQPQPGPQVDAARCPADIVFFGGTRGGGKSDCALGRQVRGAEKHGVNWNGLILRRKYKDLAEMRRRIDQLISSGLPAERVGGEEQPNHIRFTNGAKLNLLAIKELKQVDDLLGHQYTEISIEEAQSFPWILQMIDKLRGALRSAAGVPCKLFITGNPGGPGHMMVKETFIKPRASGVPFYNEFGESVVFIRSGLKDNKILCENDPNYERRLQSIRDPVLRKAWLEGDWDIFPGQAFNFGEETHTVEPIRPIPEYAWVYFSFDWGFGKPFSVGWWWVDGDGRVYRCGEWYGWNGMPDEGLRLTDPQIAQGILQRENEMDIRGRRIIRLAGPDCFQKKPNYMGGGQGPSTAEEFSKFGIFMTPGDPTRHLKIRQFRERLRIPDDPNQMPMLMVYKDCRHFIRTIPALAIAEHDPEDIDRDQETHVYDESCHICMARPLAMKLPQPRASDQDRRIDHLIHGDKSSYEDYAVKSQEQAFKDLGLDQHDFGEMGAYEDPGELVETVKK